MFAQFKNFAAGKCTKISKAMADLSFMVPSTLGLENSGHTTSTVTNPDITIFTNCVGTEQDKLPNVNSIAPDSVRTTITSNNKTDDSKPVICSQLTSGIVSTDVNTRSSNTSTFIHIIS